MRVKHKRGIKREKIPGDSKRVVPRIMSDPSRNMRDHNYSDPLRYEN